MQATPSPARSSNLFRTRLMRLYGMAFWEFNFGSQWFRGNNGTVLRCEKHTQTEFRNEFLRKEEAGGNAGSSAVFLFLERFRIPLTGGFAGSTPTYANVASN